MLQIQASLTSLQSTITEIIPTETINRCYAIAWIVSTVALSSLNIYAPITFALTSGVALGLNCTL